MATGVLRLGVDRQGGGVILSSPLAEAPVAEVPEGGFLGYRAPPFALGLRVLTTLQAALAWVG